MLIRTRLLLLGLTTLALPWAGCQYAREVEGALRDADAFVGWAFPPALMRRAPKLHTLHFLTAGVPAGWAALTDARGTVPAADRDAYACPDGHCYLHSDGNADQQRDQLADHNRLL